MVKGTSKESLLPMT
jgi:hypothetical protein